MGHEKLSKPSGMKAMQNWTQKYSNTSVICLCIQLSEVLPEDKAKHISCPVFIKWQCSGIKLKAQGLVL